MKQEFKMQKLDDSSEEIREMIRVGNYQESETRVRELMMLYPDCAAPHNLYGIIMELQGDRICAMKHYRVAWALDNTYMPARHNMERLAGLEKSWKIAFNAQDCISSKRKKHMEIQYDEHGVGHIVKCAMLGCSH